MADNLISLKFIASFVADNAKFQYDQFMTKEVGIDQENFLKLNFKTNRLDSLLYELVAIDADYSHLWNVMELIFVPTHGQSFTERGLRIKSWRQMLTWRKSR